MMYTSSASSTFVEAMSLYEVSVYPTRLRRMKFLLLEMADNSIKNIKMNSGKLLQSSTNVLYPLFVRFAFLCFSMANSRIELANIIPSFPEGDRRIKFKDP